VVQRFTIRDELSTATVIN